MKRIRHCVELYDVIRIDHFRGFDEYYSIPYGDQTAEFGHWEKGPGMDIFRTVKETLGDVKIIAEDLGFLTDSVIRMVEESGYPGMKVLEFAFDSREPSNYLPHNYDKNCVVYTGTHDNETLAGWYRELKKEDKKFALRYMGRKKLSVNEAVWEIIRLAQSSVADTCIIPIQDYLCLGNEARINHPSTLGGNWIWRLHRDEISKKLVKKIRRMTELYCRIPEKTEMLLKAEDAEDLGEEKNKMGMTIKDIAKKCGVGVSTVSRALNNHPDINPETKKMILKTVEESNFVPNNSARNLKRTDSKSIAILVKEIDNPFFATMMRVMEKRSADRNIPFLSNIWERIRMRSIPHWS